MIESYEGLRLSDVRKVLKKFGVIVKRHPKNQELYTMIDYRTDKTISHNGKDFVNIDILEEYADFWSSVI